MKVAIQDGAGQIVVKMPHDMLWGLADKNDAIWEFCKQGEADEPAAERVARVLRGNGMAVYPIAPLVLLLNQDGQWRRVRWVPNRQPPNGGEQIVFAA